MFDNISTMRTTLGRWASETYEEAYERWASVTTNKKLTGLVHNVLNKQRLLKKYMDGNSSQGLDQTELEHLKIKYALITDELDRKKKAWTPLDVVVFVCEHNLNDQDFYMQAARRNKMDFEELTAKMCARAIRALPSAIREHQLTVEVKKAFPDAEVFKDTYLDLKYHCDVKMIWEGKPYWFWSFIANKKSVEKFKLKFTGVKGSIVAAGYHVLCGFDRFSKKHQPDSWYGWDLYPDSYINEIKKYITEGASYNYDEFAPTITTNQALYTGPVVVKNRVTRDFKTSKEYQLSK